MSIKIGDKSYELKEIGSLVETKQCDSRPTGKVKTVCVIAILAWTFFNCIKPPYEGLQYYPKQGSVPAKTVTTMAGRWFIWDVPETSAEKGRHDIKITRISIVPLVTEYVGGVSLIGIGYLALHLWPYKKSQ